jgi:predicted RNA-binding Zn-ribbon protein involved in translation (DUF1610 family)
VDKRVVACPVHTNSSAITVLLMTKILTTSTSCPECGSHRIHRTHCQQPIERAARILGASILRCHECNARFSRFGSSLLRTTDLRRVSGRFGLAIALITAATMIMVSILWFSRAQSNPSSDTGRLQIARSTIRAS